MTRRRAPFLAAPALPSPLLKLAVALLVLVQLAAPSWHICELGGYSCHGSGHAKAQIWTPKCGGGPVCPCEKPPGAILSLTGQILDSHDSASHGFCLALLLMSMPGALSAVFALVVLASRRCTEALAALVPPSAAALRQPPARGPPQISFA